MMNPKDIKEKKFEKATFGYKPEEVDEFLAKVASAYAEVVKTSQENEAKIIKLVEKINEYREDEEAIKQTLLTAQKSANRILADAKAEGEKMLSDAKEEHAKLIEQNNAESEKIIKENNERCERLIKETADRTEQKLAALKMQQDNAKDNLEKMKIEVTKFKAQLTELYNKQLRMIIELPELSEDEIKELIREKTEKANAAKTDADLKKKQAEETNRGPSAKESPATVEELGFENPKSHDNEQFAGLKFGKNN